MTTTIIGNVQQVDLEIHQEAHLSFDVEWWEDEAHTEPINISATNIWVDIDGVRYDLEDLGHATFAANVISIVLPPAWTGTLPATDGNWSCEATDAVSLEEKVLARGIVRVRP